MERLVSSETSALKAQTPGDYPPEKHNTPNTILFSVPRKNRSSARHATATNLAYNDMDIFSKRTVSDKRLYAFGSISVA